jgi:hypothetical protein
MPRGLRDIGRTMAVHFRHSATSTHSRDSIQSGENSDIGSDGVVERDSSHTLGGEDNVGLRGHRLLERPQSRRTGEQTLARWKQRRR